MSDWPKIRTVGLSGLLVTFAGAMSEPANRAALAFRAEIAAQDWPEVRESSCSLVSAFIEVDLASKPINTLAEKLRDLLATRDWFAAPLPAGRTLWHVPTVYGTDLAPQLEEAAALAGVDPDNAIAELSTAHVRVLTIGFAPGQPYMGELSETWNIPRQTELTGAVPPGSLVIAIKQLIIFTNTSPTGWRHIGQTAFRNFQQERATPFALSPGDELIFPSISRAEYDRILIQDTAGNGGATAEALG